MGSSAKLIALTSPIEMPKVLHSYIKFLCKHALHLISIVFNSSAMVHVFEMMIVISCCIANHVIVVLACVVLAGIVGVVV